MSGSAAVIGGTGFLGSVLVDRLVREGVAVKTLSRRAGPARPGVRSLAGDLRDPSGVRAVVEGVDRVFHFAGATLPAASNDDPQQDLRENLVPTLDLLDACVAAKVRLVVFPSSGGTVYGSSPTREPLTENSPTEPLSSYGITKLAVEKYLALFRRLHGLDYRVLRISNAYGEGQRGERPQGLVGVTLARLLTDEPVTIWGDGSAVRDYVHVNDVAAAAWKACAPLPEGAPRVFNVSSGEGTSVRQMMAAIESTAGRAPRVIYGGRRESDADWVVLSNKRAAEILGWMPSITLAEGLTRSWEWARQFPVSGLPRPH